MKKLTICLALIFLLPLVACQEETPNTPIVGSPGTGLDGFDAESVALALMVQTGWPAADEDGHPIELSADQLSGADKCHVVTVDREMISGDIAHYIFTLTVGPGQYDHIRIHRVVKERRPFKPVRTRKAVFLQHGASTDFTYCFLPGQETAELPDDFGMAAFLAGNDVDVWGIDQRWTLVPAEETDVSFMSTWDIPMHIADIGVGIDLARVMRRVTGHGNDKMILLGFSFGAEFSFGVVDGDSQLPPGRRRIKGFIPVDMVIKVPEDSPWRELMCSFLPYYEEQFANGIYGEGAIFRTLGLLARDDPDGGSPVYEGLTNYDAAIAFGSDLIYGVAPFHLFEGVFDGNVAVGLQNLSSDAWIDFLCAMSAVEPNPAGLDQALEICGEPVAWNQHWGDIRVPVFYVGARGGFGEAGLYQLGFLGSEDLTSMMVSTNADELRDFGHLDLFLGGNAESLVWQPILEWIGSHSGPGH